MLPKLELAGPDFRPAFCTNLKLREQSKTAPLAEPTEVKSAAASTPVPGQQRDARPKGLGDQLRSLKVETDLRRYLRDNIMHHRLVSLFPFCIECLT
jgi:small subunit ribosomal protein S13